MAIVASVPASPSRRNRRRRGGKDAAPSTLGDDTSVPLPSAPKSPVKRRSVVVEDESPRVAVVAPGTPPKKSKSGRKGRGGGRGRAAAAATTATEEGSDLKLPDNIVTPSETPDEDHVAQADTKSKKGGNTKARRSLSSNMRSAVVSSSSSSSLEETPSLASSSASSDDESSSPDSDGTTTAVKKGPFGRPAVASKTSVLPIVKSAYSAINTRTGSLGGNGHGGAIYGELTVGSMQKMVDLMKVHTKFTAESRFIDVGCGLGKPNVHVALDPAVEFSYGCEMEGVRWWLAMSNLDAVLQGMREEEAETKPRCMLAHADITEAKSFDPFTHVYMFDIGFPPALFYRLAKMYNNSVTPRYLICYHAPRLMIDEYGFDLELLIQESTSMHGSSEGHMGYVYKRINLPAKAKKAEGKRVPCDPLFRPAYDQVRDMSRSDLGEHVRQVVSDNFNGRDDGGNEGGGGDGRRRGRRERKPTKKYGC